jgi:hypothetical protein
MTNLKLHLIFSDLSSSGGNDFPIGHNIDFPKDGIINRLRYRKNFNSWRLPPSPTLPILAGHPFEDLPFDEGSLKPKSRYSRMPLFCR